jgi:hypothetical protein
MAQQIKSKFLAQQSGEAISLLQEAELIMEVYRKRM